MFGIGTGELLLLMLVALLVLGPERMPKLMRDVGKTVGDLRRTSDELRAEFLEADRALKDGRLLDVAARQAEAAAAPPPVAPSTPIPIATEPEETAFDREARLARGRLETEREERASAEGWVVPSDDAGTSDRAG